MKGITRLTNAQMPNMAERLVAPEEEHDPHMRQIWPSARHDVRSAWTAPGACDTVANRDNSAIAERPRGGHAVVYIGPRPIFMSPLISSHCGAPSEAERNDAALMEHIGNTVQSTAYDNAKVPALHRQETLYGGEKGPTRLQEN